MGQKTKKQYKKESLKVKVKISRNEMATHSSILTWEILWTEETGGL